MVRYIAERLHTSKHRVETHGDQGRGRRETKHVQRRERKAFTDTGMAREARRDGSLYSLGEPDRKKNNKAGKQQLTGDEGEAADGERGRNDEGRAG